MGGINWSCFLRRFYFPSHDARSTFGTRIRNSCSSLLFSHLRCLWRVIGSPLGPSHCASAKVETFTALDSFPAVCSARLLQSHPSHYSSGLIVFYFQPADNLQGQKTRYSKGSPVDDPVSGLD